MTTNAALIGLVVVGIVILAVLAWRAGKDNVTW